ncbi:AraC family transcriptional regulator [Entomomonas asaccharolytica]|uniref:AraC family transcriptional regulator n=1 Tax=Entomomonas asaccharolytica TaxID=2785331 RepID=A0A974NDJ9_9GAMM|nr:AraC family transcriptional regulator [Entomomonas asaccharolytica]QQP84795.1 AraC family transcriptional regulator [Entomomonas asaccharolytica]
MKEKLLNLVPHQDRIATTIVGLMLSRINNSNAAESCFYQPMVAIIVQGFKSSLIGNEEYNYGEGSCMVVGVHMLGIYYILEISLEQPFLSMSLKLEHYINSQLLARLPALTRPKSNSPKANVVSETPFAVLKAFVHLIDLLNTLERIPVLAPMIVRKIHFHLLADIQLPLENITRVDGLKVLRSIENIGALSISEKCRGWLNELFRHAIVEGLINHNPAADIDIVALPQKPTQNNPYLKMDELPDSIKTLNNYFI